MIGYRAQPCSRKDLRKIACGIRRFMGLENEFCFPVMQFLEFLPELFPPFHFEVVGERELPRDVEAEVDVPKRCMRIRESVYDRACSKDARSLFTITHEIGHFLLLVVLGFALQRQSGDSGTRRYKDPEWQADCFAGELLVPAHLVKGMPPEEIADRCCVSISAARTQYKAIQGI